MSSSARRLILGLILLALVALAAWAIFVRRTTAESTANATAAQAPVTPTATAADNWSERLNRARAIADPRQRANEFGRQLEALIAQDIEAALAYLRSLPPGLEYTQGLLAVLTAMGRTNPDRALALAAELAVTREQRGVYNILFAEFAQRDPRAAALKIAQVPVGPARENALRALADTWALADLPAALAWAQGLPAGEGAPALEAALVALAASDPLRSLELAQQTLTESALERAWTAAFPSLSNSDLPAAAALVALLPESEARTHASLEVARKLALDDSRRALSWVDSLPDGEMRQQALRVVLETWTVQDAGAAGRYVAAMPPGAERDAAVTQFARTLAVTDPQAAITWVQTSAEGEARHTAMANVTSTWAQQDPAAAATWAANLPGAEGKNEALQGALSYWFLQDAGAARSFVMGLSGDTQLQAAAYLAPRLAQTDPQGALAWAQSLASADAREVALTAAYFRWLDNAPAQARAWLDRSSLPFEYKNRLQQAGTK